MHDISGERVDWNAIRQDFPILRERAHGHQLIYFDNAATSQKPQLVIDTLRNYYEHNNANVHRGLHELSSRATELYEKARERVAAYIGATSADQIIFTRGTVHPHDLTTFADQYGLALRGGHHCNQPLMRKFGLLGTARASFYFYNTIAEVDGMIDILRAAARFFA